MINILKSNWKILLISALCSLTITKCLAPMVKTLVMYLTPEQELLISVIDRGENGGSDVWVATTSTSIDLQAALSQSKIIGECEYRLAQDYGYGFDFLISYGNNLGTVLVITYRPIAGSSLSFFCTDMSGTIKIQAKDFEDTLSLYRNDIGMLQTYELPYHDGGLLLYYFLLFVAFAVIFACICVICKKKVFFVEREPQDDFTGHDNSCDLIRCVAIFLVLSVHSFLASGYYNKPLEGGTMVALTYLRWISFNCNSLFLLLTGYLCRNRTLDKHPYRSLISICLTFFIITSLRILIVDIGVNQAVPSLQEIVGHLLGMDLSWYFEMYIGLALMIPFLNLIWKACNRERRKQLILVMLIVCSVSSIADYLLPSFWEGIYPIAYYFIGAYLAEYPCTIKCRWLVVFFLLFVALETGYTFAAPANAGTFNWFLFGGNYQELQSMPAIIASVTLFLILKSINIRNRVIIKFLRFISPCAFGIYIAEPISQTFVYPLFQEKLNVMQSFLYIQIPYVLTVFAGAFLIAYPVNKLVNRIMRAVKPSI